MSTTTASRAAALAFAAIFLLSAAVVPNPTAAAAKEVLPSAGDQALSDARLGLRAAPLAFEENLGQAPADVRFAARAPGHTVQVTDRGLRVLPQGAKPFTLRFTAAGAPTFTALSPTGTLSSHHVGPVASWVDGARSFAQVRIDGLYPGIAVVLYGSAANEVEFDIVAGPGADASQVRLAAEGAQSVAVQDGRLRVELAGGAFELAMPAVYQESGGARSPVAAHFDVAADGTVAIATAPHDLSRPLVIDPVLRYATYYGGSGDDQAYAAVADASGNVYVVGQSNNALLPGLNPGSPPQASFNGGSSDAFVAKISHTSGAPTVAWRTYIGSTAEDRGRAICLDGSGNLVVAGSVKSGASFPFLNAGTGWSPSGGTYAGGSWDVFVTRLSTAGSHLSSTLFGGSQMDYLHNMACDSSGIYLVGSTYSTNLPGSASPPPAPWQSGCNACSATNGDGFVAKLNPSASSVLWSAYMGGTGSDRATGIAVTATNVYVTGTTTSTNFPTTSPIQSANAGGRDVFVAKLTNPSSNAGLSRTWSTYLGGTSSDGAITDDWLGGICCDFTIADTREQPVVAVTPAGEAMVYGTTFSTNFPTTAGALRTTSGGSHDTFLTKVNAAGTAWAASTYFGTISNDYARGALALDATGAPWVLLSVLTNTWPAGISYSPDAVSTTCAGCYDLALAKLNPGLSQVQYLSLLGAGSTDSGRALALAGDSLYVAGSSVAISVAPSGTQVGFPVNPGAWQPSYVCCSQDAFLARIDVTPAVAFTAPASVCVNQPFVPTSTNTYTSPLSAGRTVSGAGITFSTWLQTAVASFTAADVGQFVSGGTIPAGATITSYITPTWVLISAVAPTQSGITVTIAPNPWAAAAGFTPTVNAAAPYSLASPRILYPGATANVLAMKMPFSDGAVGVYRLPITSLSAGLNALGQSCASAGSAALTMPYGITAPTPPAVKVCVGEPVAFSGAGTWWQFPVSTYSFTFGDGTTQQGPGPLAAAPHTFTSAATGRQVTLTVEYANSPTFTQVATTKTVDVLAVGLNSNGKQCSPAGTATITGTPSTCFGVPANFNAASSYYSPITSYTWTFGDGTPGTGPGAFPTASHNYVVPGAYMAAVTLVFADGATATQARPVGVTAGCGSPVAQRDCYTAAGPLRVPAPGVLANDHAFGNGFLPTGAILVSGPPHGASMDLRPDGSFEYAPQPGFVGDDSFLYRAGDGPYRSDPVGVCIHVLAAGSNAPPIPAFTLSADPPAAGVPMTAIDRSVDRDGMVVSWRWEFSDDGARPTGPAVPHTFAAPGTYTVRLVVSDDTGQEAATFPRTVTVVAAPAGTGEAAAPKAPATPSASTTPSTSAITAAPTAGTAPEPVGPPAASGPFAARPVDPSAGLIVFFQAADATGSAYHWEFGDGASGSGLAGTHTYPATGDYTVRLTFTDAGGAPQALTQTVHAEALAPTASREPATVVDPPASAPLAAASAGLPSGAWFGMGAVATALILVGGALVVRRLRRAPGADPLAVQENASDTTSR